MVCCACDSHGSHASMLCLAAIGHSVSRATILMSLRVVATAGVPLLADRAHLLRASEASWLFLKVVIILPIIAVIVYIRLASVGHHFIKLQI